MSPSPARTAANIANAQASTGPRSQTGKAASSRNAITHGLFTQCDFIRPGEEDLYAQAKADLHSHLAPVGPLEYNLVEEIHRAMWRQRRCGEVEADFSGPDYALAKSDPMQNETTAKLQLSVDRARAQAHRLLHKCTAELRKLQTGRQINPEATGISDQATAISARLRKRHLDEAEQFDSMCAVTQQQAEALLTKPTQSAAVATVQIARNAPCPCHSGEKYKRCCGKSAPPVLQAA